MSEITAGQMFTMEDEANKAWAAALLEKLAEAQSKRDLAALPYLGQIKALQDQMALATAEAEAEIEALQGQVKAAVEAVGETVKGARLQAVYSVRNSWDHRGLMGYAVAHPDVRAFHTVTTSVAIRKI